VNHSPVQEALVYMVQHMCTIAINCSPASQALLEVTQ